MFDSTATLDGGAHFAVTLCCLNKKPTNKGDTMKKTYTRDFYLKRFQEVVIFLTAVNIKKHFSSLEAY